MGSKYDNETRERVLRLFVDRRQEAPQESESASFRRLHELVGIPIDTMRGWVRRALVDSGVKPGVTTAESEEIKRLRKENAELKRANEILKTASAIFANGWFEEFVQMQGFNSHPGVSMKVGRQFRLRYNCCVKENYRAVLRGDRLEWQGDGPVLDGGAVAVEVTVLRDAPSRSEQGAKMAAILERLAVRGAVTGIDDPVAWERSLREDRDLPGRD